MAALSKSRLGGVVDVLAAGLADLELGFAKQTHEPFVFASKVLVIDEQTQSLVEGELTEVGDGPD